MGLSVHKVDGKQVHRVWPLVEHFLDDALASSPNYPSWYKNYNTEQLQVFLANGAWSLYVWVDEENTIRGACTVSYLNYPLHRVAFITACGGSFITNQESFAKLKELLKAQGATKIQAYCRESAARLFGRLGFEPRTTLIETLV
jgi:hypothetical protein